VSWAAEEMAQVALGDERLNRRAATLLETMSTHPDQSIPTKTSGLAEMTAAYRFFSNDRVDEQKLLAPHRQKTIERIQHEPVVLCLEDTTQLDFTTQRSTTGLGPLYKEFQRGLFLHAMLAVTPAGVCHGVLEAKFYARAENRPELSAKELANRPPEDRESYRWIDGYQQMNALTQICTGQMIYVADRESDFEGLLAAAQGQRGHLLIRARHDRLLDDDERMWNTVWNSPVLGEQEFEMGARPGRAARTVRQTVRAMKITLPETEKRERPISFTVVIAQETNPPAGQEPVSWTLLTTLPVTTAEDVVRVIGYYRTRWVIEEYFKVLKTGCAVEKLQLETAARLTVAISMYLIIAYRVLYLVKAGRDTPDVSCDAFLDKEEWEVAYQIEYKQKPPKTPPRLIDMIVAVAKLGGFIGRKGDGFPGAKTLWIGLGTIRNYLYVKESLAGSNAGS
jgi:hypothetical protein